MRDSANLRDFGVAFGLPGWTGSHSDAEANGLRERHLRRSGYRILARNFRARGAEIDLVAMDGETLVFVEVKTRARRKPGCPRRR